MVQEMLEGDVIPAQKLVLSIANMYEFNYRHNNALSLENLIAIRQKKENFAASAEMALFWGGMVDTRVVVLPIKPDPGFVRDIEQLLGVTIKCISPTLVSGWVCRDLLLDNDALDELLQYLEPYEVQVMPWGATNYYHQLISLLLDKGIKIVDAGCPSIESHWIVDYSDSKIGSRSIIEQMRPLFPEFGAPQGYICHGSTEAAMLADVLSQQIGQPLIIKSDIGAGGSGVRLYRHRRDPLYQSTSELLLSMSSHEIWQNASAIVEYAIGGGIDLTTPSYDGIVQPDSKVVTMGIEDMLTLERRAVGVEMGKDVLALDVYQRLERIGIAVGEHLASFGYKGWYDVDFLLPTSGTALYASEINPRRGGATPPIEIAQRLFGQGWGESYFFKDFERLWLNRSMKGYDELRSLLDPINDEFAPHNAHIIPLYPSAAMLQNPYLAYIVYAENRLDAIAIETELSARLPVLG